MPRGRTIAAKPTPAMTPAKI
jgi:hypothetical protein